LNSSGKTFEITLTSYLDSTEWTDRQRRVDSNFAARASTQTALTFRRQMSYGGDSGALTYCLHNELPGVVDLRDRFLPCEGRVLGFGKRQRRT
jgi:hypothetical protein